jgi:hypothetical protein
MAILAIYLIPVVLLVNQARCWSGLVEPVIQQLSERGNYAGGWALSSTPCPAGTTSCSDSYPGCCPTDQVCSGDNYCCPTSKSQYPFRYRGTRSRGAATNCEVTIKNVPVCANPDWTMWVGTDSDGYFCCEPGLVGELLINGFGGLCEAPSVDIPASRLATSVLNIQYLTNCSSELT